MIRPVYYYQQSATKEFAMMDDAKATYREEARELLAELETSLLELEERPEDTNLINRVFRAMHTIKGSGSMFGFDDIAAFTHEVETVFDLVRNGKMAVSKGLLDLTLQSRDHISALLEASGSGEAVDRAEGETLIQGLRRLTPGAAPLPAPAAPAVPATPVAPAAPQAVADEARPGGANIWRIRFRPQREVLASGTNPIALLNELRELGACQVVAHVEDIPLLDELNAEHCYLYWDIILTGTCEMAAIKDVFIFVEDSCELTIELIDCDNCSDINTDDPGYKRLGQILIERGDLAPAEIAKALAMQQRLGELLVDQGLVTPAKVQSALAEQEQVKSKRQERLASPATEAASIRVPAERLDQLVNLVGEMVTVQAHLTQVANTLRNPTFMSIAEEVERLTNELRDTALNIRMLPIGSTFSKFKRLVRDLSQELGKEIEMETFGGDTELDKTVIEKLNDPLVHIIRNSIDHGVEMPEVRRAAGKPAGGTVKLGAEHSGGSVLITIRDDGAGLDREVLRTKAVEKGLISATAELSDQECYGLIFAPGFSTAAKVTNVSGRGVGMDVVKRGIDGLRGSISIASKKGEGTTITLKIPLTLAIIESLLVKIGDSHFVLPLAAVEECIELTKADIAASHGRNLARVRGRVTPYISLREQFAITGKCPEIQQIVIVQVHGQSIGFVVDFVVGEHQTVIKPLGRLYQGVQGLSGATILGDGSVALILDLGVLARTAEIAEHNRI
jgi:two-component system chemotaxis sensor kinase CheA